MRSRRTPSRLRESLRAARGPEAAQGFAVDCRAQGAGSDGHQGRGHAEGRSAEKPELFRQLEESRDSKHALAFFGIHGKKSGEQEQSSWAFTSSFSFRAVRASDATRGQTLEGRAAELCTDEVALVPVTELQGSNSEQHLDALEGTETTCAQMASIAGHTKVKAIDEASARWQINW